MQFLVQLVKILTMFLSSQKTGWKKEKTMGKQIYNSFYLSSTSSTQTGQLDDVRNSSDYSSSSQFFAVNGLSKRYNTCLWGMWAWPSETEKLRRRWNKDHFKLKVGNKWRIILELGSIRSQPLREQSNQEGLRPRRKRTPFLLHLVLLCHLSHCTVLGHGTVFFWWRKLGSLRKIYKKN